MSTTDDDKLRALQLQIEVLTLKTNTLDAYLDCLQILIAESTSWDEFKTHILNSAKP